MSINLINSINGPVVTIKGPTDLTMQEMVYVGSKKLIGEVISISSERTTIQVYETTTGLRVGEEIIGTGAPLSATLGPGIISNIFDGIERPLQDIEKTDGAFIGTGSSIPSLDTERKWDVTIKVSVGDELKGGDIYATCPETPLIEHRCMVPPNLSGRVSAVMTNGQYTVNDCVVKLVDQKGVEHELTLCQKWPIRVERPIRERMSISRPLITGQRVIDTMFPLSLIHI